MVLFKVLGVLVLPVSLSCISTESCIKAMCFFICLFFGQDLREPGIFAPLLYFIHMMTWLMSIATLWASALVLLSSLC